MTPRLLVLQLPPALDQFLLHDAEDVGRHGVARIEHDRQLQLEQSMLEIALVAQLASLRLVGLRCFYLQELEPDLGLDVGRILIEDLLVVGDRRVKVAARDLEVGALHGCIAGAAGDQQRGQYESDGSILHHEFYPSRINRVMSSPNLTSA